MWATYAWPSNLQLVPATGHHFRDESSVVSSHQVVDGSSEVELNFSLRNDSFYSRMGITRIPGASVHVGVYRNVFLVERYAHDNEGG